MGRRRRIPQPIGQTVLNNFSFLRRICKTRSAKRRQTLINNANRDQLISLVESCSNILKGNFKLTGKQRAKLIPFASVVRKLGKTRSERGARLALQQVGSGPGFLVPLLGPILLEAAHHLISKVANK